MNPPTLWAVLGAGNELRSATFSKPQISDEHRKAGWKVMKYKAVLPNPFR